MADWQSQELMDFTRIQEIAAGDREFEVTLYRLFIEESEKNIIALGSAIEDGQDDVIRAEAHTLKGASANTGAGPLSGLAARLEALAKAGDLAGAKEIFHELQHCFDSTVELLDASMDSDRS